MLLGYERKADLRSLMMMRVENFKVRGEVRVCEIKFNELDQVSISC